MADALARPEAVWALAAIFGSTLAVADPARIQSFSPAVEAPVGQLEGHADATIPVTATRGADAAALAKLVACLTGRPEHAADDAQNRPNHTLHGMIRLWNDV